MSNDNELNWDARGRRNTKRRELVSGRSTGDKLLDFTNLPYSTSSWKWSTSTWGPSNGVHTGVLSQYEIPARRGS
jgi:hypothetical protein